MRETAFGAALLEWLLTPITDALGVTSLAFLLTDTAALALVVAAFLVAFSVTLALTRALAGVTVTRPAAYASTLLPIAAGLPDRPLPDARHPRRRLAAIADPRPAPQPGA